MAKEIAFLGEGPTDAALARKLIIFSGGYPGVDYTARRSPLGKNALDKRLAGLNQSAQFVPVLILRDFDDDALCPGELIQRLLPVRAPLCCLRLAVRSAETWMMADADGFSKVAAIARRLVPSAPEMLDNPKQYMTNLLTMSRSTNIRRQIGVGPHGPTRQSIAGWSIDFINNHWQPMRAIESGAAPSLTKAFERLKAMV